MPLPLPKPRHTVERSNDLVRVTLPAHKSIFTILFMSVWFLLWGYMVSGFIYVAVILNKAMEIEKNSDPSFQFEDGLMVLGLFFLFFFLALLGLGAFGVYKSLWVLAGREVIEADSKLLKISRQLFSWKREKEYFADEVRDLRMIPIPSGLDPFRRIRKLTTSNPMIAFDYGAKTFRFASEIEEAEAKQIILALKEGLPQPGMD